MRTVTAIVASLAMGALLGCYSDHPQPAGLSHEAMGLARKLCDGESLSQVDTVRAIQNARSAKLTVVFVHLDWSIDSQLATYPFAQCMLDHYSSHPNSEVLFHYVDCTDLTDNYSPLTEIPGWRELECEVGGSLIHGYGEVAWMKSGRVLRVESFRGVYQGATWDIETVERFVAITEELMADAT
jgi:hypothetical protein